MTDWRVEQVSWEHPDGRRLREQQRTELDARYGGGDNEPGALPSAGDVFAFFVARDAAGTAVACGGLREVEESALGPGVVEVKRMYAAPEVRGRGAAAAVLRTLEDCASERGATRLVLETGTLHPDATRFYEKNGFIPIPLFGDYIGSAISLCYARELR